MIAVLAWTVVAVWVAATVVANLPKASGPVRRADLLGIVPAWTFFAPNPGVSDPVVLVRDLLDDGTWTPWRVAWSEPARRAAMWWRPGKRESKLVADCAAVIPRAGLTGDETLGTAFLLMALLARDAPHDWRATGYQFALADVEGWWHDRRTPALTYRSPMLSLSQR